MKLDTYYPTFGSALDAVYTQLSALGAEPAVDIAETAANIGHLYGEQGKHTTIPLASYKGKPTRRVCAVALYRLHSGRYELTAYLS